MPKRRRRRRSKKLKLFLFILALIAAIVGGIFGINKALEKTELAPPTVAEGEAKLHFIDVGQGDAILITMSEGNVLIDAGPNSSEQELKAYLDKYNITDIEYAVFTHSHEDHIGGADMVLSNYNVKNVCFPDDYNDSGTYRKMMSAIDECGANFIEAVSGKEFTVGSMTFHMLAPVSQNYTDHNNASIVLKASFGDTSFVFTGDAEEPSEQEILQKYSAESLKCDLLKVGHHGAETSTSQAFLDALSPTYAVIQVGEGNSYDHPRRETLKKLEDAGTVIYRNDILGDIVFVTDGKTLNKVD